MPRLHVETNGELYWEFWNGGKVPIYYMTYSSEAGDNLECPPDVDAEPWIPVIFEGDTQTLPIVGEIDPRGTNLTIANFKESLKNPKRDKTVLGSQTGLLISNKQLLYQSKKQLVIAHEVTEGADPHTDKYELYFLIDEPSAPVRSRFKKATVYIARGIEEFVRIPPVLHQQLAAFDRPALTQWLQGTSAEARLFTQGQTITAPFIENLALALARDPTGGQDPLPWPQGPVYSRHTGHACC